jgi:hypothetical protein
VADLRGDKVPGVEGEASRPCYQSAQSPRRFMSGKSRWREHSEGVMIKRQRERQDALAAQCRFSGFLVGFMRDCREPLPDGVLGGAHKAAMDREGH